LYLPDTVIECTHLSGIFKMMLIVQVWSTDACQAATWLYSIVRCCTDVSKNRLPYLSSCLLVKIGQIFEHCDTPMPLILKTYVEDLSVWRC